jgi:hypothetical protein
MSRNQAPYSTSCTRNFIHSPRRFARLFACFLLDGFYSTFFFFLLRVGRSAVLSSSVLSINYWISQARAKVATSSHFFFHEALRKLYEIFPTMAPRRKTSEAASKIDTNDEPNNDDDADEVEERVLPSALRQRNRAVAEREASRLARPERRKVGKLGHATKGKSAVTSTPFGFHANLQDAGNEGDEVQEWCGPFSVARQVGPKLDADKCTFIEFDSP